MTSNQTRRPIRIGANSGFAGDRFDGLLKMTRDGDVDIVFGDYLAEVNLAVRALDIVKDPNTGYESIFLGHLDSALDIIAQKKIPIISDAGALNPKALALAASELAASRGYKLKIAYVTGDNLIDRIDELAVAGETLPHLEDVSRPLSSWGLKPISCNAYTGAAGILKALQEGSDIVITGRVTDASPVIAAAVWWHGWDFCDYDKLASALLAGHCLECGGYVTGGNWSGFKAILDKMHDMPFPIAEIHADGTFVVTKPANTNGLVSIDTVRSQILYEIQGNIYLNPDVQADISNIAVASAGTDRVLVTGIKGYAPPASTKVSVCAIAGWQSEVSVYASGLDIKEKFDSCRIASEKFVGPEGLAKFTTFNWTAYGTAEENPRTQASATSWMRVFAQAPKIEAFGPARSLAYLAFPEGLGSFPGLFALLGSVANAKPTPYIEYWPALVTQSFIPQTVHFVGSDTTHTTQPPENTIDVIPQTVFEPEKALDIGLYSPTVVGPLGWIVSTRSGDKGGNVNVGFFVRNADEYPWLRDFLSTPKLQELLTDEFTGQRIERVEFPGLLAVHFVIHDFLDKGVSSTHRLDYLGKSVGEFIRAKHVDLPQRFVARGKL